MAGEAEPQLLSGDEDGEVNKPSDHAWKASDPEKHDDTNMIVPPKKRPVPCIGGCWKMPPYPPVGVEDLKNPNFGRMLGAEYLGTLFIVFIGTMSIIVSATNKLSPVKKYVDHNGKTHIFRTYLPGGQGAGPEAVTVNIAFAFGISVAAMVQNLGHVSGGHFNPAISAGLLITGRTSIIKTLFYIIAQCLGATTGALLTWLSSKHLRLDYTAVHNDPGTGEPVANSKPDPKGADFSDDYPNWGMGATTLAPGVVQFPDGMMTEFTLTFFLVFTVCAVTDPLRKDIKGIGPLIVGLACFASHLAGITLTGSSINPARSLGPAIFSDAANRWSDHWLYWVGPIMGGMEAGFIYTAFFSERPQQEPPQSESLVIKSKSEMVKSIKTVPSNTP